MKKQFVSLLIALSLMTMIVLAFGAQRSISGEEMTITLDVTGTNNYIVKETIPSGVTVSNVGQGGVYNSEKGFVKWVKTDISTTVLTYSFAGNGLITGVMTGGNPAVEKTITQKSDCTPSCTNKQCGLDGCGGQCPNTCAGALTCDQAKELCVAGNPVCGNNIIDGTEVCDGTNVGNAKCTDQPQYTGGTLKCTNCLLDSSQCIVGTCTNGAVDYPGCSSCPAGEKMVNNACVVATDVTANALEDLKTNIGNEISKNAAGKDTTKNKQVEGNLTLISQIAKFLRDFFA